MTTATRSRSRSPRPRRVRIGQRTVLVHGLASARGHDLYHFLMKVDWPRFYLTVAAVFVAFNLVFSLLYYARPGCIANLSPEGWPGAFFFSVETVATVGYGDMHPASVYGHVVATTEIFVGLMAIALLTGITYARFSQPRSRVMFSRNAVVRPMDGRPMLMLRAANARHNIIIEASAKLRLLRDELTAEGVAMRRIVDLPLVREQQPLFALGWTLMHEIDERSPLAGQTAQTLRAARAQLVVTLRGLDETTGQEMTARTLIHADAIRWDHAFRDMLKAGPEGVDEVHFGEFDAVEPLADSTTGTAGGAG